MNLALFQRGTPHVEILILAMIGVFLMLWAVLALLAWLKSKPWRHVPEASLEDRSTDEATLPGDGQEKQDISGSDRPMFIIPPAGDVLPHRP